MSENDRSSTVRRAALAGAVAAAVGAAGYGIAVAALAPAAVGGQPASSAALAASGSSTQSSPPTTAATPGLHGMGPGGGRFGHLGRHGAGGTVTAVAGDSITVKGPDGQSRTALTDGSTRYLRDGRTVPRSALAVGERVLVRPRRPATGAPSPGGQPGAAPTTATADVVDIVDPHLGGTVVSTDGAAGTITVTDPQGFTRTIHVTGATAYTRGTAAAAFGDVTAGEHVEAFGSIDGQDRASLDATEVRILQPGAAPEAPGAGAGLGPRGGGPDGPDRWGGMGPMGGRMGPGGGDQGSAQGSA